MAEQRKDGGPAFPRKITPPDIQGYPQKQEYTDGMSLRDYFAAKAMNGILHEWKAFISVAGSPQDLGERVHYLSRRSYEIADAMIQAREQ